MSGERRRERERERKSERGRERGGKGERGQREKIGEVSRKMFLTAGDWVKIFLLFLFGLFVAGIFVKNLKSKHSGEPFFFTQNTQVNLFFNTESQSTGSLAEQAENWVWKLAN